MSSIRNLLTAGLIAALVSGCAGRELGSEVEQAGLGQDVTRNLDAHVHGGRADGMVIALAEDFRRTVPNMINFAFDSAILDTEAQRILDQQAGWLLRNPQAGVRIYGHTDLVGSSAYNFRLGQRRADAAAAYLVSRGVAASRLEAVVSFGQTRPILPTPDPERLNRRTVTDVVAFFPVGAGFDFDGKRAAAVYGAYVRGERPQPAQAPSPAQIFIAQ